MHIQSRIVNQSEMPRAVSLEVTLLAPDGRPVKTSSTAAQTLLPGKTADVQLEFAVASPALWDLDHPNLYHAVAKVRAGTPRSTRSPFPSAFAMLHFDAATGFWLNGRNFKIKGVCLHGDGGAAWAPPSRCAPGSAAWSSCARSASTPSAPRTIRPRPNSSTSATAWASW